jgi:hypothetical protein
MGKPPILEYASSPQATLKASPFGGGHFRPFFSYGANRYPFGAPLIRLQGGKHKCLISCRRSIRVGGTSKYVRWLSGELIVRAGLEEQNTMILRYILKKDLRPRDTPRGAGWCRVRHDAGVYLKCMVLPRNRGA